jgi:hypothetical protein
MYNVLKSFISENGYTFESGEEHDFDNYVAEGEWSRSYLIWLVEEGYIEALPELKIGH